VSVLGLPYSRPTLAILVLAPLLWLSAPSTASADENEATLRWNPRFTRFTTAQYMLTGVMAGGLLATDQLLHASSEPRWRGDILLDGQARSLLGASSEGDRRSASNISDMLAMGLVLYPFVIDSGLVAAGVHGNYDVAYQMALISVQAVLATKLITGLTKDLVGRARPDSGRCEAGNELACGSETESFISGHTSGAFAGAGLICAHHQNLPLYGDNAAGAVACGLSLGTATTVGALRLVAGRHHLSDVLAGAAVGMAAGYLLPNLLNYDFGESNSESDAVIMPIAGDGTLGVSYMRSW
jgi:membrane-associated phospholipid phosphatase